MSIISGCQEQKNYKAYQRQTTQFEETEQALETGMARMLKSDPEFKTTMVNMPRVLVDNVDSMQE